MDGFDVSRSFQPKEVSVLNLSESVAEAAIRTESYRVTVESAPRTPRFGKYLSYVRRFVHGLDFANGPNDKPYDELLSMLRDLIQDCERSNALIGYKGGNHERDLLLQLGCLNLINIERLGCPKFNEIYKTYQPVVESWRSCEAHLGCPDKRMCSRVKLLAYRLWLCSRVV